MSSPPSAIAPAVVDPDVDAFIARWAASGGAERANFQLFAAELCDLLGLDRPAPATDEPDRDAHAFEYPVTFADPDGTRAVGRIDLYKRGAFVMEAKQGSDRKLADQLAALAGARPARRRGTAVRGTGTWAAAMQRARGQAEAYAKALPTEHGWPPFLIVTDVGHSFELYADFSLTGKSYSQFPDAQGFRVPLDGLREPLIRERLRLVWTDPHALDPARRGAEVTREVSSRLAAVARSLEADGHPATKVAGFVMRCLFSMFAEDVGLLPEGCFTKLLGSLRGQPPERGVHALQALWREMDEGAPYSGIASGPVLRFNGGLFAERTALPLRPAQLDLLIAAGGADWRDVEPAIFGTFLEQALDPRERSKLGAEFTPRRWVERLIMPAVIEPLRERWNDAKTTALAHELAGDRKAAVEAVRGFHRDLCATRVLDPACGTGNFLYVTMEHMKRLEGEALDMLRHDLGAAQDALEIERFTVDPHQFLGIEVNPRAAAIAEVVLWIGHLQWHFKTRGKMMPAEPVLKNFRNIERRDALLEHDGEEAVHKGGQPVTRWDGRSMRLDPATGREVPDETKRVALTRLVNPRPATWPEAEYIVGNPPFIGKGRMRDRLGGYAEALWQTYPAIPESADFVMYWWQRAAELVKADKIRAFGLITTSSITQTFNRRVVLAALEGEEPIALAYATPNHPWFIDPKVASARVRVAMTVGTKDKQQGKLARVLDESEYGGDTLRPPQYGRIQANLTVGVNLDAAKSLVSNKGLSSPGVMLGGAGFSLTQQKAYALGLGNIGGIERHIRPYRNGKDLTSRSRELLAIDLFGLSEDQSRQMYPAVYQHLLETVKPERDQNPRASYRNNWWLFSERRPGLRQAAQGIKRYIATVETARHRVFQFLPNQILPDHMIVCLLLEDNFSLGVVSSRVHLVWSLAMGARLGRGNDPRYSKSRCFDPFPFPDATEAQRRAIGDPAEELDGLRKRVLAEHPDLTLTGLYNVLEKLCAGEALTVKERDVHDRGLVSVIRRLHERIDDAVADAYGWPAELPEEDVLARLVALNVERRAEEARGLVRWLRPDYQAPADRTITLSEQGRLAIADAAPATAEGGAAPWPADLPGRVTAVRGLLAARPGPARVDDIAAGFQGRRRGVVRDGVAEVLTALAALGLARRVGEDRYAA